MEHKELIQKIDKLIVKANTVKLKLLESSNGSNTVISKEQAKEILLELRDKKLKDILS